MRTQTRNAVQEYMELFPGRMVNSHSVHAWATRERRINVTEGTIRGWLSKIAQKQGRGVFLTVPPNPTTKAQQIDMFRGA